MGCTSTSKSRAKRVFKYKNKKKQKTKIKHQQQKTTIYFEKKNPKSYRSYPLKNKLNHNNLRNKQKNKKEINS
jgi:hypothetical protein